MGHAKIAVGLAPVHQGQAFAAVWSANGMRQQSYHMPAFKSENHEEEDPQAHAPDIPFRKIEREILLPEKKDTNIQRPQSESDDRKAHEPEKVPVKMAADIKMGQPAI